MRVHRPAPLGEDNFAAVMERLLLEPKLEPACSSLPTALVTSRRRQHIEEKAQEARKHARLVLRQRASKMIDIMMDSHGSQPS